jgi:hypothetical protein
MSEKTARRQDILELMSNCSDFIHPGTTPVGRIDRSSVQAFSESVRDVHASLERLVDRADALGLTDKSILVLKSVFKQAADLPKDPKCRQAQTLETQFKSVACHLRRMAKMTLKAENHPKCFPATIYGRSWTPAVRIID